MAIEATLTEKFFYPGGALAVQSLAGIVFADSSELAVRHLPVAGGAPVLMAEDEDYTIGGSGATGAGTITPTAAWDSGERWHVERVTAIVQPAAFPPQQPLSSRSVEQGLDRLTRVAQEQSVGLSRALQVEPGAVAPALDMANLFAGQVLAFVGGKFSGVDNDPASAADSAAAALAAKTDALDVLAQTEEQRLLAQSAKDGAAAAALTAVGYYPAARSYVPQGAATGAATISAGGSGGTNGTFDLAFTGGNFAVNPTGTFTVAGGVVTAINITGAGLYVGAAISKPTLSFAASAGLIGATGTFGTAYLRTAGQYYLTDHATNTDVVSLFQNVANAAVEVQAVVDWLNLDLTRTRAESAATSAAAAAAAALRASFQIDNRNTYVAVAPGAAWNGTAGSGFAVVPSDPTRTTAKPACRLMVPPYQWFTDYQVVGVAAYANNNGSLADKAGLEKVIVHFEGRQVEIKEPSYHSFQDANGNTVSYFGWWAVLLGNGVYGNARVYFEAVPKDATMQRRVIGPYQFSPKAAKYSHQIEVAATPAEVAGARYKTLNAALNYLKAQNAPNPLITFTEAGEYTLVGATNGWANGSHVNGYVHITATAPVVFQNAAPAPTADPGAHRPGVPCHFFGSNVTIDFKYASELWHSDSTARNHWLDGINLTNSVGRYDLYRKGTRNGLGWLMRAQAAPNNNDGAWATECRFSNLWNAGMNTSLVRGCRYDTCWSDLADHSCCFIANRIDDFDSTAYAVHLDAMTVTYTGTGTTATIERSSNTFSLRVDGAVVSTFTALSTLAGWIAGTNYNVANVVDWINGIGSGWAATLTDDTRVAWTLVPYQASYIPGGWPAQNVKGVSAKFGTTFDIHADWWQKQDGAVMQNIVCADNLTTRYVGAIFLIGDLEDAVFLNNFWHCKEVWDFGVRTNARSQMGDYIRHFVFAHNAAVNQLFWLRNDNVSIPFDSDAYSLWASNVLEDFRWQGTIVNGLNVADNHIYDGYALPTGMTGVTQGGTAATNFPNAGQGNTSPSGTVATITKPPRLRHDLTGGRRASTAALGAAI